MRYELAHARDAEDLMRIRSSAENWLAARGIAQWCPGEVVLADVSAQIARAEWFVARRPTQDVTAAPQGSAVGGTLAQPRIAAALRYLAVDPELWPHDPPGEARYVHGLMVDRAVAPPGAGAAILRWAEQRAAGAGAAFLRLDCVEANARLRRFYAELGYKEVGRRDFTGPWFSATLLEKPLRQVPLLGTPR